MALKDWKKQYIKKKYGWLSHIWMNKKTGAELSVSDLEYLGEDIVKGKKFALVYSTENAAYNLTGKPAHRGSERVIKFFKTKLQALRYARAYIKKH